MSRMDESSVLFASGAGSVSALWSRIDAGMFPRPSVVSTAGLLWDPEEVQMAITIHPPPPADPEQREQPQPPAKTRERKDDARTETRES